MEKISSGAYGPEHNYRRAILPLIVISGAAVRIFQIGKESLWYDELYTVWASKLPLSVMLKEVPASGHPLLYYLLAHFWNQIGSGDAWYRMISWAAGVATIWFVYLLGKELFTRRIGLWAAAFAAFSPFLIWYSRDATNYSLPLSLSTLSIYLLVRSVRRGGWQNWIAYSVATLAALFSHFYLIALLPAEIILFLFIGGRTSRQLRSMLLSLATVIILLVPWLEVNSGASRWVGMTLPWPSKLKDLLAAPFVFSVGYAGNVSSGATPISLNRWLVLAIIEFAVFVSLLLFFSRTLRRALRGKAGLGLCTCALVLIIAPALVRADYTAGRDIALGASLFFVILALALCAAPRRLEIAAGLTVLTGLIGLTFCQFIWAHNDDWRGVIESIDSRRNPGEEVLCFPLHNCVVASAVYQSDLPLQGGEISIRDFRVIGLQKVPGWKGYLEGYGLADNYSEYRGSDLTAVLRERFAHAGGVWLVAGTRASGQLRPPDGIEEAIASAGWVRQVDFSSETINLWYYGPK